MDLFEKCRRFHEDPLYAERLGYPTNPHTAQALGLYPDFIPLDESGGTTAATEGRRRIRIGSNNYLGLTTDPRARQVATDPLRRYGTSSSGSRFLNGMLSLHVELEERLAWYVGKKRALVFATGYQANLGAISALVGRKASSSAIKSTTPASSMAAAYLGVSCDGPRQRRWRSRSDSCHLPPVRRAAGGGGWCVQHGRGHRAAW